MGRRRATDRTSKRTMNRRVLVAMLGVFLAPAAAAQEVPAPSWYDEDSDRVPLHTVVPAYPEDARRDRIEGEVQVCYYVDKRGRPYRIAVRNSTHRVFERPSLRAVRGSTYKPLEPGEKNSGIKTCRTFRFELQPIEADNRADRNVLDMSIIIVMGPTPPGTGVTAPATASASS